MPGTPFDPHAWIDGEEWVYAKTWANAPHWYVHASRVRDRPGFAAFMDLIAAEGRWEYWGAGRYQYLRVGAFDYWAMRGPDGGTVNRREATDGELAP